VRAQIRQLRGASACPPSPPSDLTGAFGSVLGGTPALDRRSAAQSSATPASITLGRDSGRLRALAHSGGSASWQLP
jgi:hypothetical protein